MKEKEEIMRIFILSFFLFFLFLSSCSTIRVEGNAKLVPHSPEYICKKVSEKRAYYLLWGLIPISNNSTEDIIPPGKDIRIETKFTGMDILIGLAANILIPTTISSMTAEVYICSKE
ncbi:MAG: hypothetical protein L3J74_15330 [Bacteroidales bacterium]|nr:hypothetical protein [Bacteroidales bacterium]